MFNKITYLLTYLLTYLSDSVSDGDRTWLIRTRRLSSRVRAWCSGKQVRRFLHEINPGPPGSSSSTAVHQWGDESRNVPIRVHYRCWLDDHHCCSAIDGERISFTWTSERRNQLAHWMNQATCLSA